MLSTEIDFRLPTIIRLSEELNIFSIQILSFCLIFTFQWTFLQKFPTRGFNTSFALSVLKLFPIFCLPAFLDVFNRVFGCFQLKLSIQNIQYHLRAAKKWYLFDIHFPVNKGIMGLPFKKRNKSATNKSISIAIHDQYKRKVIFEALQ